MHGIVWSPSESTLAAALFDANIGIRKREGQDGDDLECLGRRDNWRIGLLGCNTFPFDPVAFMGMCGLYITSYSVTQIAQLDADFEHMGVLRINSSVARSAVCTRVDVVREAA